MLYPQARGKENQDGKAQWHIHKIRVLKVEGSDYLGGW